MLGDPDAQGKRTRLPVDAYYETLNLVVEYRERQHTESVPIMDRRSTISSVPEPNSGASTTTAARRYCPNTASS